jgi:hypothetical protein
VCRSCWHSHNITPARAPALDRIGAHRSAGGTPDTTPPAAGLVSLDREIVVEKIGSQHYMRAELACTHRLRAVKYLTPGTGDNLHTVTWLGGRELGSRGLRAARAARSIPAGAPACIEFGS